MKRFVTFIQEEIANCMGSGNVATFDPVMTKIIRRRNPEEAGTNDRKIQQRRSRSSNTTGRKI